MIVMQKILYRTYDIGFLVQSSDFIIVLHGTENGKKEADLFVRINVKPKAKKDIERVVKVCRTTDNCPYVADFLGRFYEYEYVGSCNISIYDLEVLTLLKRIIKKYNTSIAVGYEKKVDEFACLEM